MNKAVFPVMICPYTDDNKIDLNAVDALVEWYHDCGCDGIFTACLSTEIQHLTLEERVLVTDRVVKKANEIAKNGGRKMTIVASGHMADDFDEQVREITSIHATGVEAVILISNRLDIENTSEDKWIEDLEKLINAIPKDITLGVYECPYPYKRLLTDKMLEYIAKTKRFAFIKDTCCDAEEMAKRVKILEGSGCGLYNANAQTLLQTLRDGAAGYSGIMANFHPELYNWLCKNVDSPYADLVQSFFCMSAFTEYLAYPCTSKIYLNKNLGLPIKPYSRTRDYHLATKYHTDCIDQMEYLANHIKSIIGIK